MFAFCFFFNFFWFFGIKKMGELKIIYFKNIFLKTFRVDRDKNASISPLVTFLFFAFSTGDGSIFL